MKIGFVIVRDNYNFDPFRIHPLNIFYLLTRIEEVFKDKVELSVIDLRGIKENLIKYYIEECDIFLYSIATINFSETIKTLNQIKYLYPFSKHIAGGIHVNIYPHDCSKFFNSVAIGEGDNTIIQIINDIFNSNLKNIYVETNKIDVNEYPFPNRKYLPRPSIVDHNILNDPYQELNGTSVLFSRGCPFKCHFCANLVQSAPRFRSPENIINEIEYLKKEYNIQALAIKDDNIISVYNDISKKTLSAIGECNVKWRGSCRANGISRDVVHLAKQSGCVDLAIGIESVDQQVLNNINKRLNIEKATQFCSFLREEGIGIRLNLIIGLPGEPKDVVKKTIKFVEEISPSSVLLSILTPVPGSEIYNNPSKFGIKLNPNLSFDKLFNLFGRFDDTEEIQMAFQYEKTTPFGESITNQEIVSNYMSLQQYFREKNLVF